MLSNITLKHTPVRNRAPSWSSSLRCVSAGNRAPHAEQCSKTGRTKPRKHLSRSDLSWSTRQDFLKIPSLSEAALETKRRCFSKVSLDLWELTLLVYRSSTQNSGRNKLPITSQIAQSNASNGPAGFKMVLHLKVLTAQRTLPQLYDVSERQYFRHRIQVQIAQPEAHNWQSSDQKCPVEY